MLVHQLIERAVVRPPSWAHGLEAVVLGLLGRVKVGKHGYSGLPDVRRTRLADGVEYMAHGHFSRVFKHTTKEGDEYAIKVSLRDGDGAMAYLKYAKELAPTLPADEAQHLPRVYFVGKLAGVDIAVTEWLATGTSCEEDIPDELSLWADKADECYATPSLRRVACMLYAESKKRGIRWDLHSDNFRYNDDGEVVITDPWSFIGN